MSTIMSSAHTGGPSPMGMIPSGVLAPSSAATKISQVADMAAQNFSKMRMLELLLPTVTPHGW